MKSAPMNGDFYRILKFFKLFSNIYERLLFLIFFKILFFDILQKQTRNAYESFLSNLFKHLSMPMNGHRISNFLFDIFRKKANEGRL